MRPYLALIFIFLIIILIILFLSRGVEDTLSSDRIVISLTTTPNRLPYIRDTVKSLTNQIIPANAVYLNIPHVSRKGVPYIIPEWLKEEDGIILNRCEDMGPITKIAPTLELEKDPNTIIIVVDDDEIYPNCLVQKYLKYCDEYKDEALTFGGVGTSSEEINF